MADGRGTYNDWVGGLYARNGPPAHHRLHAQHERGRAAAVPAKTTWELKEAEEAEGCRFRPQLSQGTQRIAASTRRGSVVDRLTAPQQQQVFVSDAVRCPAVQRPAPKVSRKALDRLHTSKIGNIRNPQQLNLYSPPTFRPTINDVPDMSTQPSSRRTNVFRRLYSAAKQRHSRDRSACEGVEEGGAATGGEAYGEPNMGVWRDVEEDSYGDEGGGWGAPVVAERTPLRGAAATPKTSTAERRRVQGGRSTGRSVGHEYCVPVEVATPDGGEELVGHADEGVLLDYSSSEEEECNAMPPPPASASARVPSCSTVRDLDGSLQPAVHSAGAVKRPPPRPTCTSPRNPRRIVEEPPRMPPEPEPEPSTTPSVLPPAGAVWEETDEALMEGLTPLMGAVLANEPGRVADTVRAIRTSHSLSRRAQRAAINRKHADTGRTALHLACMFRHTQCVRALLDGCAGGDDGTVCHCGVIHAPLDLNPRDNAGTTPLMLAAGGNSYASPSFRTLTPLGVAVWRRPLAGEGAKEGRGEHVTDVGSRGCRSEYVLLRDAEVMVDADDADGGYVLDLERLKTGSAQRVIEYIVAHHPSAVDDDDAGRQYDASDLLTEHITSDDDGDAILDLLLAAAADPQFAHVAASGPIHPAGPGQTAFRCCNHSNSADGRPAHARVFTHDMICATDDAGWSSVTFAARCGWVHKLATLRGHMGPGDGFVGLPRDALGRTLLHHCSIGNERDCLELVLAEVPDANDEDTFGLSPYDYAAAHPLHPECARLLLASSYTDALPAGPVTDPAPRHLCAEPARAALHFVWGVVAGPVVMLCATSLSCRPAAPPPCLFLTDPRRATAAMSRRALACHTLLGMLVTASVWAMVAVAAGGTPPPAVICPLLFALIAVPCAAQFAAFRRDRCAAFPSLEVLLGLRCRGTAGEGCPDNRVMPIALVSSLVRFPFLLSVLLSTAPGWAGTAGTAALLAFGAGDVAFWVALVVAGAAVTHAARLQWLAWGRDPRVGRSPPGEHALRGSLARRAGVLLLAAAHAALPFITFGLLRPCLRADGATAYGRVTAVLGGAMLFAFITTTLPYALRAAPLPPVLLLLDAVQALLVAGLAAAGWSIPSHAVTTASAPVIATAWWRMTRSHAATLPHAFVGFAAVQLLLLCAVGWDAMAYKAFTVLLFTTSAVCVVALCHKSLRKVGRSLCGATAATPQCTEPTASGTGAPEAV